MNEVTGWEMNGENGEEEDQVTDVDDPTPLFFKPVSTLPGKMRHNLFHLFESGCFCCAQKYVYY